MALFLVLALAGCAKLQHLGPALVLRDYSRNQDEKSAFVAQSDGKFEKLIAVCKEKAPFSSDTGEDFFLTQFGPPVLMEKVIRDGSEMSRWLYRYQTGYFGPKVYVFFHHGRYVTHEKHP